MRRIKEKRKNEVKKGDKILVDVQKTEKPEI